MVVDSAGGFNSPSYILVLPLLDVEMRGGDRSQGAAL
jgi:hypothetical protein